MANEEQLAILKQGAEVWNQWREENAGTIPDLTNADLNWAELNGAKLSGATLCGAKLNGAELIQAKLTDADLSNVDLTGADLSQAELNRAKLNKANLSRAKLSGAKLLKADLSGADLSEANIGDAYLEEADLTMADVSGANLSWSNLYNGKLSDVILSRADLRGADLSRADLSRAALGEADLSGTFLGSTLFANVDLSRVIGLESVVHLGPSTIGIDTLYRSQGKIPDIFLRGAGIPDEFIEYMPHLISGKAIQFYSCFISYSTKDQEFAERLHADLLSRGVRCWFAPEDIKGGKKLHEQIPEAIRLYDKLLLVLSEDSMQSEWVKTEIHHAWMDEKKENRRKLFPISLVGFEKIKEWEAFDADLGKDMGREIREYYIPDFSNWKDHDAYKKAFDRLMRDLNLEGEE